MNAIARMSLHLGALGSLAASLTHVWAIVSGPAAYRSLGAPDDIVASAEAGTLYAPLTTLVIAVVICVWAIFAWSALGVLPRVPLLRTGLIAIASVLLLRAVGWLPLIFLNGYVPTAFDVWSSVLCAILGLLYLVGTVVGWRDLGLET